MFGSIRLSVPTLNTWNTVQTLSIIVITRGAFVVCLVQRLVTLFIIYRY